MKRTLLLLGLLAGGTMHTAHADVEWNHRGSVKVGGKTVVFFGLKNQWSGQKHRASLLFDATKATSGFGMPTTKPIRDEVQVIERLDDDRLLVSSTENKTYIDEPYRSFKGRLRINFWEVLGSDLSADKVPQLTPEQRQRLGQEIRAVVQPFAKKVTRTYFRPLPQQRVIGGLTTHGYRITTLFNTAAKKGGQEWVRATAEWWLADGQQGDEEVRAFTQSATAIQEATGGPTASMWANETYPILWEAMPIEMHDALASVVGIKGTTGYGFKGTPVQFFMTITPPPTQQMMMGDVRVSLDLTKRDTSGFNKEVFDAPSGYKRIEVEPFLGMARNFMKMGRAQIEKMIE